MPRTRESERVRRIRLLIVAGLAVAAVAVLAVGLWAAMSPVGEVAEGEHYTTLPGADASRRGPVTVTEYFSYGCVHCANFDPQLEDWREDLPEGVRFERVPVVFSAGWRNLAAAYYAARDLGVLEDNHEALFEAIHREGRNLASASALASFFDGRGTDAETFRRAMRSPEVLRRLERSQERMQEDGVRAVPTLVIDGRYRIDAGGLGRQQMLEVADRLVEREREARAGSD